MRIQALANPDLLTWARRSAGFDVEEVARKLGSSPERIQSWERGDARPSVSQLRKLADTFRRPLGFFFLNSPPPEESQPADFRRFDPTVVETISPALRFEIRAAHDRRSAALELFDEIAERPPLFELSASLSDDPEVVAETLRRRLLSGGGPPVGNSSSALTFWRDATERAGILVFQARDVEVEEMRGFSISSRPLPTVVLNIKDAATARNFSLLHELAHVMLDRGGLCVLEERGPQTDIRRIEAYCNHVAGATLLPAASFLKEPEAPHQAVNEIPDDAIQALSRRYGASREAVVRRFVILNLVSAAFYQRKRNEYARENADRRTRVRKGGFALPSTMAWTTRGKLFTRLVLQSYDDERITSSAVAEHLGVRLKWLDRIRGEVRDRPLPGGTS